MIKHLKILLSRKADDGTSVDYVENLFNSEDGSTVINNNLFVGSHLLLNIQLFVTTVLLLFNTGSKIKDLCCCNGLKICKTTYLCGTLSSTNLCLPIYKL